jgi:DNA-binding MarR family transcriptional regulator
MAVPKPGNGTPDTIDMSYLEGTIGYAIRQAQIAVFADIYRSFGKDGLTVTKFSVLAVVADNPGINQAMLAEALNVERPRMVPLLTELEKKGLVLRASNPADRRNKSITLTEAGREVLAEHKSRFDEHETRMKAHLADQQLRDVLALLWHMAGLRG